MKLIKSSYEIIEQKPGLEGIYEQIELAGRTCYKSTRPEGQTAKDFVDRMIASQHYAMLEHGTVYLLLTECAYDRISQDRIKKYQQNHYSKVVGIGCDDDNLGDVSKDEFIYRGDTLGCGVYGNYIYAVTTNYRVLVENGWLDDLKYLCEPTEHHEKRVTVRFTTSNGIMREFTRHRSHSFAVESTRYCNYSGQDKFGSELTFIIPSHLSSIVEEHSTKDYDSYGLLNKKELVKYKNQDGGIMWDVTDYLNFLAHCELTYLRLTNFGRKENRRINYPTWKAQEAREVLPLATKCDMVMTGFISDWRHFFRLRTSILAETGKPHPDAAALADPLYKEFIKRNLIAK